MTLSGFTFVRNGTKLGYPFEASLRSLMELCDEVIVNVGQSDDDTLDRVRAMNDGRLSIIENTWDEKLRRGGRILAQQTDLALEPCTGDWCVYLQADEVMHEEDRSSLLAAMNQADKRDDIDGLLFDYVHFYGSFHTVGCSRRWYRREIRAFKRGRGVRSYKDAQGFRILNGRRKGKKLRVIHSHARVFHYGWARPTDKMLAKTRSFERLYRSDAEVEKQLQDQVDGNAYRYDVHEKIKPFVGSHPACVSDWVSKADWEFTPASKWIRWRHFNHDVLDLIEHLTHKRFFEYRNYELVSSK